MVETRAKVEFIILKYVSLNIACYYSYGLYSLAETTIFYNVPAINESGEGKNITRGNTYNFLSAFLISFMISSVKQ